MSIHHEIEQAIREIIGELDTSGVESLGPTAIALRTYEQYGREGDDLHVRYASTEHFKQMARALLARQYEPDADESQSYQGDMFSGHLQDRYPIPRKGDEDPIYKRRDLLTVEELRWNSRNLRKSANARVRHADAIDLYIEQRSAAA